MAMKRGSATAKRGPLAPDEFTEQEGRAVFAEWSKFRTSSSRSLARARFLADGLGLHGLLRDIPLLGVVGSKGKGTAAIFASAAIASAGLKVGTILSPGVISNLDRIRVNGRRLGGEEYRDVLSRLEEATRALPKVDPADGYLSPGGLFMIGGLEHLARTGCDVIVVEAGMGGARDEISLFPLDTVVVTGVFGEHLDILGPTVVDIAKDKSAVITEATRHAFTLPQSPAVREVIVARAGGVGVELTTVDTASSTDDRELYPPGLNRMNAELGTIAGLSIAEAIVGTRPDEDTLVATLRSVTYPGRLSVHQTASARVVVDSAVSRDALVTALVFSSRVFGGPPARILVSLPRDKDFAGFVAELQNVAVRKVFVGLGETHLHYPDRAEWPWEWAEIGDLSDVLSGDVLAVGTVSFSAEVLRRLAVDSEVLFSVPGETVDGGAQTGEQLG
jgi:dihydrofolate synthase/folylpolyglutamate synthase